MTLLLAFLFPVLAAASELVSFEKSELANEFLLQTSYELSDGRRDFMTSRSRLVVFERRGDVLRVVERRPNGIYPHGVLAALPIRDETARELKVDFNAGFSRILRQEDRTGEDYYIRFSLDQNASIRLTKRRLLEVSRRGRMLVIRQAGRDEQGSRVVVHYYLTPYRRNSDFKPFEVETLDHFGFYETYPRRLAGRTVFYAMKFDVHEPIVFALSERIPAGRREAVRDGVRYWNKALGAEKLRVINAPGGVTAPHSVYNVIEWLPGRDRASTSHIQSDPLTGEILHANIFIRSEGLVAGDRRQQDDHLRYVVAHEVGHALGLRHNFARGPVSTVMNYFDFELAARIGNDVIESGAEALEYDRKVVRHVYLRERIDVDTLPPFCTDGQAGCSPVPALGASLR